MTDDHARVDRPRSQHPRTAVLHAVEAARLTGAVTTFDTAARTVLERLIARGELPYSLPLATATASITGPASWADR